MTTATAGAIVTAVVVEEILVDPIVEARSLTSRAKIRPANNDNDDDVCSWSS